MPEKEGFTIETKHYSTLDDMRKVLQLSEISLILTNYDDIFSDFDPRPYHQKALSIDFLDELKRASNDKNFGKIELRFLAPAKIRDQEHEKTIKKRLHEHFKKHLLMIETDRKGVLKSGITMTLIGVMMLLSSAYIRQYVPIHSFFMQLVHIILEPGGWFTGWTGLDQLFYTANEKKQEIKFYEKMSKADISFISY